MLLLHLLGLRNVNAINILFSIMEILLRDRKVLRLFIFHVKLPVAEATAAVQANHYTEHDGDYVCVILVSAVIT